MIRITLRRLVSSEVATIIVLLGCRVHSSGCSGSDDVRAWSRILLIFLSFLEIFFCSLNLLVCPTPGWAIACSDGILSPTAATLIYEVTHSGESVSNFTYSVDFVMQWSEDVTLNSTLSGFQLSTSYEYVLTYLYPSEGVYVTNFTAVIRADEEIIDFLNIFANSESGAIKIEEESCVYPFSVMPASVAPTIEPGRSTATIPTNDTPGPTSASAGKGAHSSTILSAFTVTLVSSVYLILQ